MPPCSGRGSTGWAHASRWAPASTVVAIDSSMKALLVTPAVSVSSSGASFVRLPWSTRLPLPRLHRPGRSGSKTQASSPPRSPSRLPALAAVHRGVGLLDRAVEGDGGAEGGDAEGDGERGSGRRRGGAEDGVDLDQ